MSRHHLRVAVLVGAFASWGLARTACAQDTVPGSTAFCLFEVPADETGKRRWINLGIVQYIEATPTELRVFYGGGALGSGHEVRIPFSGTDDVAALMDKLRKAAAACR